MNNTTVNSVEFILIEDISFGFLWSCSICAALTKSPYEHAGWHSKQTPQGRVN